MMTHCSKQASSFDTPENSKELACQGYYSFVEIHSIVGHAFSHETHMLSASRSNSLLCCGTSGCLRTTVAKSAFDASSALKLIASSDHGAAGASTTRYCTLLFSMSCNSKTKDATRKYLSRGFDLCDTV
ncbi:TPA: hypothetical protein ACH3X1_016270 [Trebouxia sp. C0004]